jgi:hypothetical protein
MTAEEMAQKIFETVLLFGPGCSFVDLQNHCGKESEGDCDFAIPTRPNTVVWVGLSPLFIDAFNTVKSKIALEPASALIYMMDGKFLRLPLAKRPRKTDYKTPHWFPATFRVKDEAKPSAEEWKAISHRFAFGD